MNIVTALNRRYIPYTTVMLLSLGMNNDETADVYLMHSELLESDIDEMQAIVAEHGVVLHSLPVDRGKFNDRLPRSRQWSIEAYYRLMMLELLPKKIDRALYLDGDMVINKSLKELYEMPFGDASLIVADDKSGLNTPESYYAKHREMFAEAYKSGHRYFNSGMMLLNIESMRKRYSFQTYLDAIEAWNYEMEAPDQDILNWVHWREIKYVDYQKYNFFARIAHNAGITYEEMKAAVAIVHFAGAKPWDNDNFHFDIEKLWWDYAKLTPYYRSLLERFIETSLVDRSVPDYLKELVDYTTAQKELLNTIMAKLKKIVGEQ